MTVTDLSAARSAIPDVTVIVPVYNTMPYLTECLASLARQTIGLDRLEVITVDDGSTDGGSDEVDRFANRYPGSFVALHQANSGGPAGPCNVGLEHASGRYVFFLGSDDYLGDEALLRLVSQADAWDSDVIFATMVAVNGRSFDPRIYRKTKRDLDFIHHPLAYCLSNTKMFRRSRLDEHKIRYPEGLKVGSDQPFVVAAMVHARRISVLSGYPSYYAVKRLDATNISYSTHWRTRLVDLSKIIHQIAAVVPAGETRDHVLRRHFQIELDKLLRLDLPLLGADEQREIVAGCAALSDCYLTDGLSDQLRAGQRVRHRLAQTGDLETLLEAVATLKPGMGPPFALRGDRAYVMLPGFDQLPLEWYEVSDENIRSRLLRGLGATQVTITSRALTVSARAAIRSDTPNQVWLTLLPVPVGQGVPPSRRYRPSQPFSAPKFAATVGNAAGGLASDLSARVPLPLDAGSDESVDRWSVRLQVRVADWIYDLPLSSPEAKGAATTRTASRIDRYQLATDAGARGVLILVRQSQPRVTVQQRFARLARRGVRDAIRRTPRVVNSRLPRRAANWIKSR